MSIPFDPPRVAYVASGELIEYADLLPSNQGRSSLVHSLAYHLDLLDLGGLEKDDRGIGTSSERNHLLRAVAADGSVEASVDTRRRRATVYLPHAATHQQLTSYHEDSFVKQLSKGADAGDLEHSHPKRRKLDAEDHPDNRTSSEPEVSDTSSHASDSSEELHLRPSSSVSGTRRKRGYKRPRPEKNQFGLQDDCPAFEGLQQHVSLVAGAAITAAELLAKGQADIAIAWDGGRHHAKKNSASGFCYVNDVVLAILSLRKPRKVTVTATVPRDNSIGDDQKKAEGETIRKTIIKRVDRVLYLDLDLHWGDGVEEAFHSSPNVLTLSIHHYAPGFFPCYAASSDPNRFTPPGSLKSDTGAGSKTLNIPLGIGASDASLERIMSGTVQPLVDAWDPEMIVVQCGVDGLAGDPMAMWNLSAAAYVEAVQRVLSWNKPTLLLGGGGYNSENAARCWSLLTAVCLGRFEEASHNKRLRKHVSSSLDEPLPLTEQKQSEADGTSEVNKEEVASTSLDQISYKTPIPDHKFWPNYDPTYTLDVPAGEMIDQNDEAHFEAISKTFTEHIKTATPTQ
ncbi:potential Sin3.Rpd3 histone deacetylase complex component [Pseudozyma hubeiensis SY62]|uniref:Potential Sin3.Rpd3 histone deacetylase complex component n=1 Tax=Pseudozyma hubeiensis (strain SY62) TaxID=1305764 RepID=R9PP51_PSEHS|nr:potential Sin3.Rpd3 histone deacetylase complex component [Pseudozyma hubeiensis SY62]GAC99870.1 potential Sin3.Rpd3 histone deacetylase complex component [Pseudozyma hubeiensis SY62]